MPAAPAAPAWSPVETAADVMPEAKPKKKPRWSTKEKLAKGGKPAAPPAPGKKPVAAKGKGRPGDKPKTGSAAPRRPRSGNAPPVRGKG